GVGIGQGVAAGPVARMAEALPAPEKTASTAGADAERVRVREAVAAVAADLQQRAAAAGGAAHEVLEAPAIIAEDAALMDASAPPIWRTSRSACSRTWPASPRPASPTPVTPSCWWPGISPRRTRRC